MVDVLLLNRLRALAERRRWMIGIAVGARCRRLTATLVAADGNAMTGRVEVVAYRQERLPPEIAEDFHRLRVGRARSPADAALVAARLAECQAALLDNFSAHVAPVWERVSAVAVDGPGLWRRAAGLTARADLCDAARLADLTGLNVIDAFSARDLAQDGRGRPLMLIPFWILLHDLQKARILLDVRRSPRITYLPASRDATGASRVSHFKVPCDSGAVSNPSASAEFHVERVALAIAGRLPQVPRIEELVFCGSRRRREQIADPLVARLPGVRLLTSGELGVAEPALISAGVAVLGYLHLDQVPANVTAVTGARTSRVLGRLTPGSLANWHRLLRDMVARRPSVVTLRSAI